MRIKFDGQKHERETHIPMGFTARQQQERIGQPEPLPITMTHFEDGREDPNIYRVSSTKKF